MPFEPNKKKFIFQREKFGIGNTLILNALYNLDIKLNQQGAQPQELHRFTTPNSGSMSFADFLTLHAYHHNSEAILKEINENDNVNLRHLVKNGDFTTAEGVKNGLLKLRKDLMALNTK